MISHFSTKCDDGRCVGYNEKTNIFNAARHFTTFLLPHGAPRTLQHKINALVSAYSNATWSSDQLLSVLSDVVDKYRTGAYLNRSHSQHTGKICYLFIKVRNILINPELRAFCILQSKFINTTPNIIIKLHMHKFYLP